MKRNHPHSYKGKGCQIISKFFKTSSTQDVKDTSKKDTDSVVVSKVSLAVPVLQKLTKLRESLSRRALYTEPVGFYRKEQKEKMEEIDKIHPENKPEIMRTNMKELSECDDRDTPCSFQDNTVISISSDSSNENTSKSLGHDQSLVAMDTEEECLHEGKKTFDVDNDPNKDDQDTDFVNSDTRISCETELNGDDKSIEIAIDLNPSIGVDETDEVTNQSDDMLGNVTDTGPIKINSQFPSDKKITDSETTYDSQLSCDSLNYQGNDELGSDSDDDLLSPTPFLYEKTAKPIVRTPEKTTTPLGASPMSSPVKPVRNIIKELDERNYRFSVKKLLKEKNRKEVKNAALIKIEADLDAGIKKGGVKNMTDMISEDETDPEIDDGKDLSECKLPKEVSKHLVKVSNFSEELFGEDIFPKLDSNIMKYEMPTLNIPPPLNEGDTFCLTLLSSKPDQVKELINGGWIMHYYLKRPCTDAVAEWVFHIMCFCPDIYVSSQSFRTLWALLKAGNEEQGGIPKGVRGMTWVPSVKSIILVLQHYGATLESIIPNELKIAGIFPLTYDDVMKSQKTFDIPKSSTSCNPQLVFVIGQLIQFVTHCLRLVPLNFTVDDLHCLLMISCRLSLDLRMQEFLFDIEMLIFEVLNCFGESQWEEQVRELPLLLVHLSTNHRDLLHILHVLPLSQRGCQLRNLTCVILIHYLIKEFSSGNAISNSTQRTEILQSIKKTATFEPKVSKLLSLADEIKPKPTSNYFLLHTIISLYDLAIGNDDHSSSEQAKLKKLASRLSSLIGDIKDPRAAYLDRTKVKDLLVRTVNKIHFLVQAIKPKEREVREYFETNSSDYEVHTLGETVLDSPVSEEGNIPSPEAESISSQPSSPGDDSDGSNENPLHDSMTVKQ